MLATLEIKVLVKAQLRMLRCIILLSISVVLIVNCSLENETRPIEESLVWIVENIRYVVDENNNWQTPSETLKKGEGDCEDFVILAIYIIGKGNMMFGEHSEGNHAWLNVDGQWWEPQTAKRCERYSEKYNNIRQLL